MATPIAPGTAVIIPLGLEAREWGYVVSGPHPADARCDRRYYTVKHGRAHVWIWTSHVRVLKWSRSDTKRASSEGWDLFEANGKWCIQKIDEIGTFKDDRDVFQHVNKRANAGSALHLKALALDGAFAS